MELRGPVDGEKGKRLTGEINKGGIFSYNENEKNRIDALKLRWRSSTTQKRVDIISYLINNNNMIFILFGVDGYICIIVLMMYFFPSSVIGYRHYL